MIRCFFLLFLLSFTFFSCKKEPENDASKQKLEELKKRNQTVEKPQTNIGEEQKQDQVVIDPGLFQPINKISETFEITALNPADFKHKFADSDVLKAYQWEDKQGINTLIITRKGPIKEESKEWGWGSTASLYAVQFLNGLYQQNILWDIYDFEKACPFDLWIGLVANSLRITDLNQDGISETTLVYKKGCRSDVSPSEMKLIMHEANKKMALRGWMFLPLEQKELPMDFQPNTSLIDTTKLTHIEKETNFIGRYKNEIEFVGSPREFISFARQHWVDCVKEKDFTQFYEQTPIVAPSK